jgi:aminoglycoside phosphotransferase (APT) family kinase protein
MTWKAAAMDYQSIPRSPGAFQEPVSAEGIQAVCRRAFGDDARATAAVELGGGMYNSTYRVELVGHAEPLVLRVAPEPGRQCASERTLMRNEYATLPYLAGLAHLLPRVLAADWSREVLRRDWMIQTFLDGVAAPERLGDYPRTQWPEYFRQMGAIARQVHAVRGEHFGPVAGPVYDSWSQAVVASLRAIADDLDQAGLDATDMRTAAAVAAKEHAVLDEVREPRLLAGDLWTVNTLLGAAAPTPLITGVLDLDRGLFGDPAADWTIRMASTKSDERTAFWESYGPLDGSPAARWRSRVYEARHLGAVRLERHRLGNADGVRETYSAMARVLADLA